MDTTVCSHRAYKLMICVVASKRRPHRPREAACWPIHTINLQYVAVIKDSQKVAHINSVGNLFTDQVVLYYTKGVCRPLSVCLMSVILLGEGGKEKA